ncbi:MAG: tRNA-dihydrouridine synthase family protein [Lentisphaerae bacterium]|nr:tRNA-dihydrouridine synthase family protein [Lentisphaerota bacterium]
MAEHNYIYPENAVLAAPLSGYTDLPYRRSLRRQGCLYCFTEMVDAASIAYNNSNSGGLLHRGADEDFLAVQLVGGNMEHLRIAVDAINEHSFDVFDFNLGCPVPKVAKKHAGAALGRDVEMALKCFELLAQRTRFPITAKIRILDEVDPAPTLTLVRGLSELGARAITIHGRVMSRFYSGNVFSNIIAECVKAVPSTQIIANGGVMSWHDAEKLRRESTCSVVMTARGMMGNPWIFREIAERNDFIPPTVEEWAMELKQHIEDMCSYYGEGRGMTLSRKLILDYLRGRGFGGESKNQASGLSSLDDFYAFLERIKVRGPAASYFVNPPRERRLRKA